MMADLDHYELMDARANLGGSVSLDGEVGHA